MRFRLKQPLEVFVAEDQFHSPDAIVFATGKPHVDAGRKYASVGDRGYVRAFDSATSIADVELVADEHNIPTEIHCSCLLPPSEFFGEAGL